MALAVVCGHAGGRDLLPGGAEVLHLRLAGQIAQAPLAAPPVHRTGEGPGRNQAALRSTRERLSDGSPDWTDSALEVLHQFEPRKVLIGTFVESSRFGLEDRTWAVEGYYPLSEGATAYLMAAASDTHQVLPRDNFHAQLAYSLGGGWGLMAGLRHARYDMTSVDVADLTLERYFSAFRAAFTVLPAHSSSAGNATSFRVQLAYYYGDENRAQLFLAKGTEVDRLAGAGLVVATPVRGAALTGRHWLSQAWALEYVLSRQEQGAVTRKGAGAGLRFRF